MEVFEEPGLSCSYEQKKHEGNMIDSGTEVSCSSERKGCAGKMAFTCTENNAEKVDKIFAKSAEKAADVIQSNEASVNNFVNVEKVEHAECINIGIRNTGLVVEGALENKLDNCNTGVILGDMNVGDFDQVNRKEDYQQSEAVEVKETTFDSHVENTLSSSEAGVYNVIPRESDRTREENGIKIDDCMNETEENSDKHFCDMSDLAYVTSIVLETPTKDIESKQVEKTVSPMSGHSSLLEKASKYLGRRLVPIEYDSSGTEDSNSSTTELSSSSTESSTSSSSSSENSDEEEPSDIRQVINYDETERVHHQPPKTKDEILPQELPGEEEVLCNDLPEDAKLEPAGEIQSFVELLLVIKAFKETPALDADTIFFRKDRKPFGKVYDVFGPVQSPFYVIRFSSENSFENIGLKIGDIAYFAPDYLHVTKYIFVEHLRKMKGSDASWQHDQEPPPEFLDYSDDEEEAKAKAAAKKKRQNEKKYLMDEAANDADGEDDAVLQGKTQKGMKNFLNGIQKRDHQADKNSSEKSNFNPELSYNNAPPRGRATGFIAPFPNQRVRQQERPSHPHSMTHQTTYAPRFNAPNERAKFINNGFHASNPMCYQKPMLRPAESLNTRMRADQGFVNGSIIGNVKEQGLNCTTTTVRDSSMCDQEMAPPSQERAANNSNENHLQQGLYSIQNDSHVPQQNQGPSYRPGYTFPPPTPPPPPPPMWPRFDPTVPPPMLPSGVPPRVMLHAPPGVPPGIPPPNTRNPPHSHVYRQNMPHVDTHHQNWRT